jgi:lipopolysaccharide transport system ATP-binding protein
MGKMGDVARQGRTIFLVSHNMGAIKSLSDRVVLIEDGRVVADGEPDAVVNRYLSEALAPSATGEVSFTTPRSGTGEARFRNVAVRSTRGEPVSQIYFGQPFRVAMTVEISQPVNDLVLGVFLSTTDGTRVAAAFNTQDGAAPLRVAPGTRRIEVELNPVMLPRMYSLDLLMAHTDGRDIDFVTDVLRFEALRTAEVGSQHYPWHTLHGYLQLPGRWKVGER